MTHPMGHSLKFHLLKITSVIDACVDAILVSFDIPDHLKDIFCYQAGQHLTLSVMVEGKAVRRSYSICSLPNTPDLSIVIKQINNGLFSHFAKQYFKKGMMISVLPPLGNFVIQCEPNEAKHYVMIVAGSGITPILAIMSHRLLEAPKSRFTLLYGNRQRTHILFADALDALKNHYLDRVSIHHFLTREDTEISFFNRRLNSETLNDVIPVLLGTTAIDDVFICGPNDMIDEVMISMEKLGISKDHIHCERFGIPLEQNSVLGSQSIQNSDHMQVTSNVTVIIDGVARCFDVSAHETILSAGEKAGLDLPYSCRGGVCCTCRAKIVKGNVTMMKNYALTEEEVSEGYILTCQSLALSSELTVSFDE